MKLPRRQFLWITTAATALLASSGIGGAQDYPRRPMTMVVPTPAGSAPDAIGRLIADRMSVSLGQPVIVENVGGAGGTIGVGRAARAAGDGYTFTFGNLSTHVISGAMYALPYHIANDFEPIALLAQGPHLLVAKKDMPANNLRELIAWLRANPDKATAGTAGVGSPQHIFAAFFQNVMGTHFPFVHYRGAAQAIQDLVAGRIDLMDDDLITALPQVRADTIKAFAVMAKKRLAMAPEIPTVDEEGLPGFYNSVWTGLWAPKGTPKDVVAKLNAAARYALGDPTVRRWLEDSGVEVFPPEQQSPQALGTFQRAEIKKWWPIIRAAGIRVE